LSEMVLRHFNEKWALPEVSAGARASVIGKVTTDGIYRAYYEGELVCNAAAQAITEGLTVERPVKKPRQNFSALELDWQQLNLKKLISDLIATDNLSSREVITENYDQSVQGNTFLERSWADAAVVRPLLDEEDLSLSEQQNAFAVGVGGSARLGRISPFRQAAQAVVSAVSKAAAVGARTVALTDCLCYGSPEVPEEMWEFTEGVRGIKQAAESLQLDGQLDPDKGSLPFVSGNVSLYNRSARSAVNPTVTICSYSVLGDASRARRNYWQQAGSKIVLLGELGESLAASELAALLGETGSGEQLGELDFPEIQRQIDFLIATSGDADLINAASSIEEGGLIYKLLEMSFKSNLGFKVDLVAFSNAQIFSEYQGFVLEVAPEKLSQLEKLASEYQVKLTTLGEVVDSGLATIQDRNLELDLAPLKQSWQSSLRKRLG
jgi:phosphoribosylformylglycinamidine synthase